MNKNILNAVVQEFIIINLDSDISSILLKKIAFKGVETKALIEQIEAKKSAGQSSPSGLKPKIFTIPISLILNRHLPKFLRDINHSLSQAILWLILPVDLEWIAIFFRSILNLLCIAR